MDKFIESLRGAKKSRLVWLNTAAVIAATLLADGDVRAFVLVQIGADGLARVAAGVAALNIVLRFVTTKPLAEK